jgi:hypothetical protein
MLLILFVIEDRNAIPHMYIYLVYENLKYLAK